MHAPSDPRAGPELTTWLLFAACALLASGNYVAVRFSNLELPPMWGAGVPFAMAAGVFALASLVLRLRAPRGADLRLALLFGALNFGLFFAFGYWSLVHVTAGTATIVTAATPLLTLLLASAQGQERLGARPLFGALLALAGVAWLTATSAELAVTPLALLTLLLGALSLAQSIVLAKRLAGYHPAVVNAIAMSVGAALLLGLSSAVGERWSWPALPEARWALLYLVSFGSVGLFALTLLLIRRWKPSATAYLMVAVPFVTLGLEALLAGTPIRVAALVGALLVIAGVWFGALAPRRRLAGAAAH